MTTVSANASSPQPTNSRAQRFGGPGLFAKILYQRMLDDATFQQAAALAYNTLFSLLPIFVIALLITSLIGGRGENSMGRQVEGFIFKQLGLNEIRIVDEAKTGTTDLASYVSSRLDHVREFVQSPQSGILAFATLLWGAISLMMVIEGAFSRIYRSKLQRPLYRRLLLYWCVLTLGPLGVAGSLWLTNNVYTVTANVSAAQAVLRPLSLIAGYIVSFLVLLIIYRLVPDAPVRWASALRGAAVGTVLWEGGKYLFGLYVAHCVGYGKWYGTLGLVPLFMFWIYLTWNFVLLGLEVSYIHQHFAVLARRMSRGSPADTPLTTGGEHQVAAEIDPDSVPAADGVGAGRLAVERLKGAGG